MKKNLLIILVILTLICIECGSFIQESILSFSSKNPILQTCTEIIYSKIYSGKTFYNDVLDKMNKKEYSFPNIVPSGDMPSLYTAVRKDKTGEIKDLAELFMNPETKEEDRLEIIDNILFKMSGSENIDENSRGEYINAKHLNALEKVMGRKFFSTYDASHDGENPKNPNLVAGQLLEDGYYVLRLYYYASLMNEMLFSNPDLKDTKPKQNLYFLNMKKINKYLNKQIEIDETKGKEKVYQTAAVIKGFGLWDKILDHKAFDVYNDDCFYTLFTQNDRDLKWKIDSLARVPLKKAHESKQASECYRAAENEELDGLHLRKGDDVIYGGNKNDRFIGGSGNDILDGGDGNDTIDGWLDDDIIYGGNGNDILRGGQGNDIIIAGDGDDEIYPDHNDENETAEGDDIIRGSQGNDNIVSVFGNDTYIFNKGDGNDIVSDFKGNDTIYFGDGITWADLSFIKEKDDMLITIDDTKDSILIKDWFKSEDNIIENFRFKAGMAHRANEIKIE